jgi:hypothetical protein
VEPCLINAPAENPWQDSATARKVPATLLNRSSLFILLLVLAVLTVFQMCYVPTKLAHYTDPIIYLSGAESLAKGEGYHFATHAGNPRIGCHPPLHAAYLSLFWRLYPHFPENLWLLYSGLFLCVLATFALFYRLCCKSGVPPAVAGLGLLAWGFSLQWNSLFYGFMSDILFGLLGLILATYWMESRDVLPSRRWFITGIIVALMYLTRTAALAVVGVLALVAVFQACKTLNFRPLIAYLVPILPTLLLWKLWADGAVGYGEYIRFCVAEAGGWKHVLGNNLSSALDYLSGLGFLRCVFASAMDLPAHSSVSNTPFSPILTMVTLVFCWAFTALWLAGCWRAKNKTERVLASVVAAYLLQLCLYPANLSERALYAILPFVLLWAWKGFSALPWRFLKTPLVRYGLLIGLVLTIIGNAAASAGGARFLNSCSHPEELNEVGLWLRTNSPPETVVAATLSEPLIHFYHASGRKTVENYFQIKPWFSVAARSADNGVKANYVLLCWYSHLRTNDLRCELQLAKQSGRYQLFRVISDPGAGQ